MKRLITAIIVSLTSLQIQAFEFEAVEPESLGFDSAKLQKIRPILEDLYQDGRIPNYAMGVYSNGQNIYLTYNGKTSTDSGSPVDENTIYWLASMTKPIVSTAIMKLQEEGNLTSTIN
jgi:CubicO group peptidase (beta-lactamase class C family)